ncbi:MAG: branched-chain amino acid ABC transporter permease [Coriobacteriia bacterium]|nr:branched-chain amino acid ABC transporter permease [Coriobacteriia bacterium]
MTPAGLRAFGSRWGWVLAVAVAVSTVPFLTSNTFLVKILTLAAVNVIVVGGLALLFGYAGQVSLGHAAFVGIGAYAATYLTSVAGWPWPAAAAAAVALSVAGGLLLALPSLRLRGHYLAMATLGFGEIVHLGFVEAEPLTGGVDGMRVPPAVVAGLDLSTPAASYLLTWGCALLAMVVLRNVVTRRPGRAMLAMHGSEEGAVACGIDLTGWKVAAFGVSAALAGLAGVLYAQRTGFVSPSQFGLTASILFVAMAVLGGARSLLGPAVAAVLLTLLPYIDALVPGLPRAAAEFVQAWVEVLVGFVIIAVMLFAPSGLAGLMRGAAARLRPASGPADTGAEEDAAAGGGEAA